MTFVMQNNSLRELCGSFGHSRETVWPLGSATYALSPNTLRLIALR